MYKRQEYIFQQIHKDERCLLCVRDPRSKTRLYYDTKGYLTLKEYLQAHLFAENELLPFLLYVLEDMVQVNAGKPVSMRLEHVFLSYDGGLLRFLVVPLLVDNWLFQKEELKQFIRDFLDCVRVTQDFAALGFLGCCLRKEDLTLPLVLQLSLIHIYCHGLNHRLCRKPVCDSCFMYPDACL